MTRQKSPLVIMRRSQTQQVGNPRKTEMPRGERVLDRAMTRQKSPLVPMRRSQTKQVGNPRKIEMSRGEHGLDRMMTRQKLPLGLMFRMIELVKAKRRVKQIEIEERVVRRTTTPWTTEIA
jgi:hypothetical protein